MGMTRQRKGGMKRRTFLKAAGVAGGGALAWRFPHLGVAWGGAAVSGDTPEERAVNGAKALQKKVDLNVAIWGQYYNGKMLELAEEFKQKTGVGIGTAVDINVFQMPQRVMAEALAKSSAFDIVHMHASMVPTLANAGYLQPLNKFMERGAMVYRSVGPQAQQTHYHGENYGFVTDGNVHATGLRKDLFENPEERKKFQDQHGKEMKWPETWEDYVQLAKFFTRPPDMFGVSDLRARKWGGPIWFLMQFYANGGFPFANDMSPTLVNDAGRKAVENYLALRAFATKEQSVWGTTQNIPFTCAGNSFMWTYWTGAWGVCERADSKTKGKWAYGEVPGSRLTGKLVKRTVSDPVVSVLINRRGQNPEAAYWLAQYWCSPKNSTEIIVDPKLQFHDPWAPEHFKDPRVAAKYTPQGMEATARCLEVTTPPILLPGHLEFTDVLDKNLADAYTGAISGDEALKKTEAEWRDIVKRVGARLLTKDLANYKAAFPKVDVPKG